MKIVNILGGLGNQMFQYALAVSLRKLYPKDEIKIDISNFRGYPLHNGYELDKIFPCSLPKAKFRDIVKVGYPYMHYQLWRVGHRILPKRQTIITGFQDENLSNKSLKSLGNTYFDGYWQSEVFFKEARKEILQEFSFPIFTEESNMELCSRIQRMTAVAIHVRRGDYVDHPLFKDICTVQYYLKAIALIKSMINAELFVIFSNDIVWTRKTFGLEFFNDDVVYVDWNKGANSYRDMQLMSLCKHNIIANSSFSWWGAWLNQNPDKIVLAPYKWTNRTTEGNYIPEDWIRIKNEFD